MGTTCKNALLGNSLEDIEIFPVFSVTCLTKEIITHVFGMPFPPAAVPFWGTGTEEGRTYQTPGPVSELCSLRTMTSHRKPEDGWGHQSLQSGHSCSRQPCLIAPWPASRCHSKNRRERERFVGGLWAVCGQFVLLCSKVVIVISLENPWGFSSPPLPPEKDAHSQHSVAGGVPSVPPCAGKVGKGFPLHWWDALPRSSLQDHLYFSTHICLQVLKFTAEP